MAALRAKSAIPIPTLSDLPAGPCNYRDLESGQRAPVCGCKRFWIDRARSAAITEREDEKAWCFCGHHACFHDAFLAQAEARASEPVRPGSGETYPGAHHFQQCQAGGPTSQTDAYKDIVRCDSPTSNDQNRIGLGLSQTGPHLGIWDVLNTYARTQAGLTSGPGSTVPSTAAPSITGPPAQDSSHAFIRHVMSQQRSMGPPLFVPSGVVDRENEIASATEVNTPSIRGTPDLRAQRPVTRQSPNPSPSNTRFATLHTQANTSQPSTPRSPYRNNPQATSSQTADARIPSHIALAQNGPEMITRGPHKLSELELQNIVKTCAQRLDILESLSTSYVPIEEIEEKLEMYDARIIDLENWKTDAETLQAVEREEKRSNRKKRRLLPAEMTASFSSESSFNSKASAYSSSSALSATAAVYAEYNARFDDIDQRFEMLEERMPSYNNPWQVEVILLPFGRHLPGIWMSSDNGLALNELNEDWNGLDSSAKSVLGETDVGSSGWNTDSIRAWADTASGWCCPKACGPNGDVYKRLQSRGLVRTISLTSADAHNILQICNKTFARFLTINADRIALDAGYSEYHALKQPLVPLRKVRKSARLRFLQRSEMVTPATWDATFLDSSVFMKVRGAQRRLYLTTPQAYTQSAEEGWTWLTIRELPQCRDSQEDYGGQTLEDAKGQAYWDHHPNLDYAPSLEHSFTSESSHQSQWSMRSQASESRQRPDHPDEVTVRPKSASSDARRQTFSLPASVEEGISAGQSKRRVASFDAIALEKKRRRTSGSSGFERHANILTPRLSREPPSPFTSEKQGEQPSQGPSSVQQRRGGTPFAYATPHSNTITTVNLAIGDDGDTEADTEIIRGNKGGTGDDEWHGVADDMQLASSVIHVQEPSDSDSDEYDEDIDEGLTIFGE